QSVFHVRHFVDRYFELPRLPRQKKKGSGVMKAMSFLASCLVVSLLAGPAVGQIDSFFDVFYAEIGGDVGMWNELDPLNSGGSGWTDPPLGPWIAYPGLEPQEDGWGNLNQFPSWWNQWFYDGNYRPGRHKEVDLVFDYQLLNPTARGGANIVINWSWPTWSNPNAPPLDNQYIGRAEVGRVWLEGGLPGGHFAGHFDLRLLGVPFNPEWVSIDVTGYNVAILNGHFDHYCIPEPGTAMLLMLGAVGVLMISRRA
ncbi:MAG: PEP-CTERM sorting domain-containing protein, partial [Planctomycetes bacterium]|nr:PEP-CTERM sorting domain-containing protein [Planctomycetota bacterium]